MVDPLVQANGHFSQLGMLVQLRIKTSCQSLHKIGNKLELFSIAMQHYWSIVWAEKSAERGVLFVAKRAV